MKARIELAMYELFAEFREDLADLIQEAGDSRDETFEKIKGKVKWLRWAVEVDFEEEFKQAKEEEEIKPAPHKRKQLQRRKK
ncbi:hypothetical protein N9219_01635 [bacterium]|nr:hypothetical protein [bacterium]